MPEPLMERILRYWGWSEETVREHRRHHPTQCAECGSAFRTATWGEMLVIEETLRKDDDLPPDVEGHQLLDGVVCAECGYVSVFTGSAKSLAVWCPGFRIPVGGV